MPKGVVVGTEETGYLDSGQVDPALLHAFLEASTMAPIRVGQLGTRVEILTELATIKAAICGWHAKDVEQVLREASAYSARCTELWTELRLVESGNRDYFQLRTMQVEMVLKEIDRQYKFAQSKIAVMRQEIDLSR